MRKYTITDMDIVQKFKKKTKALIEALKKNLKGIRTNRPSTSLVEDIKVDYHGERTPLQHVSSISVSPPREIVIRVWEDDMLKKVTKAIEKSDLDLSPNVDDEGVVRIFLPELSKERKKELVSYIKNKVEKYRIQVRKTREDFNNEIEKMFSEDEIGEDDKYRLKEEIQKETDRTNDKIKELFEQKKEIINK